MLAGSVRASTCWPGLKRYRGLRAYAEVGLDVVGALDSMSGKGGGMYFYLGALKVLAAGKAADN